mgnify:CR=1 FL=1
MDEHDRPAMGDVVVYNHARAYHGFTLIAPLGARRASLVNMDGVPVHSWDLPYPVVGDAVLLPTGRLLYCAQGEDVALPELEGAAGSIVEVDWDGNIVWRYDDPRLHHTFSRTESGSTFVLRWVELPKHIARAVRGGRPVRSSEAPASWSDAITEVGGDGLPIWEWRAYEHLDPESDSICPHCPRTQWPGLTACSILPDGKIATSLQRTHNVAIIERSTGSIRWRWGLGEIAHASAVTALTDGHLLILDNGMHTYDDPMGFSRVLEVDPSTDEIPWIYEDVPRSNFYTSVLGNAQRLPNQNTLICDATEGRVFEVTPSGETVWEFYNSSSEKTALYGRTNYIFRAYRYGPGFAGLPGNASDAASEGNDVTQSVGDLSENEVLQKRLESLGY